jgi:protein-tyrosine phosphatase
MFHIFSKKQFLKDLLEGFVDIHCHILPGIDDGAKNVQDSINLIKGLTELGVKEFIATPHIMQDFYPNNDETIGDSFQILLEAISSQNISNITINPSAEYMMDSHFEELIEKNNIFPLKTKYLLVEMSYFQPPMNLKEIIIKIKNKGYLPVLAHPERYPFYHNDKDYYKSLKQLGCFFQLNLLSLSDHYGKNIEKTAHYLINEGLIDFAGTDTHNSNHVQKLSNLVLTNKYMFNKVSSIIKNTNNTFSVI